MVFNTDPEPIIQALRASLPELERLIKEVENAKYPRPEDLAKEVSI